MVLARSTLLKLPKNASGTNCAISGTGFLVSGEVIRENGGWPFHLLTEDIEFSVTVPLKARSSVTVTKLLSMMNSQ